MRFDVVTVVFSVMAFALGFISHAVVDLCIYRYMEKCFEKKMEERE